MLAILCVHHNTKYAIYFYTHYTLHTGLIFINDAEDDHEIEDDDEDDGQRRGAKRRLGANGGPHEKENVDPKGMKRR